MLSSPSGLQVRRRPPPCHFLPARPHLGSSPDAPQLYRNAALAVMMLHMHSQRRKHVKASRKSVMQAKIEAASAESSAINTPARSTRSRSSKPQVANS